MLCVNFYFLNNGGAEVLGWRASGRVALSTTVGAGPQDAAGGRGAGRLLYAGWPASAASAALLPGRREPARTRNQLWTEVSFLAQILIRSYVNALCYPHSLLCIGFILITGFLLQPGFFIGPNCCL